MRQTHVAGDKAFVDFSGKKIPIIDPATGSCASQLAGLQLKG
jgi:transposase